MIKFQRTMDSNSQDVYRENEKEKVLLGAIQTHKERKPCFVPCIIDSFYLNRCVEISEMEEIIAELRVMIAKPERY